MERAEPWYLGERAVHLAIVALTRVPEVTVTREERGYGVDLLVSLGGANSGGRVFGVEVKGVRRIADAVDREWRVRTQYRVQLERLAGDAPFPVGFLVFDMSDDAGYFGWFLEPVVPLNDSAPQVRPVPDLRVEQLTPARLREVIASVSEWYDARVACRVR
ncbi:MAG TPA: hypothetical protein VK689_07950 [Armatimonadota bacterium]|nr:hypothetical protein [Armatimonadota bacterium]